MQNIKSNLPICFVCDKQIQPLDFELGSNTYITDLRNDTHLKCRIRLAKYHAAGLRIKWLLPDPFIVTKDNQAAFDTIEKIKQMSYQQMRLNGIYLYGNPGTGKSHLLTDLFKHIIDSGVYLSNITWRNTSTSLTQIKNSFGKKYEYEEETGQEKILNKLKVRYLFLDDLGTEAASDWAKEILYEVINHRYEEQLPTFITGNLTPQELSDRIGDKFMSRIIEMCKTVKVQGEDWRLRKADNKEITFSRVLPSFSDDMAYWDPDRDL